MELTEYIDKGLVHSLHTSERKSFRSCRRRWDWTSRQMYYPRTTPAPLEFGVAFHAAMEKFYDPKTWHYDSSILLGLALVRFKQVCDEQLKKYKTLNGEPDQKVYDEYADRVKLGLNMIKHYINNVSRYTDVGFTPIAVEIPFEIAILGPDKEPLWCTCPICWRRWTAYLVKRDSGTINVNFDTWRGLPVTYGGRLDMLARDNQGRFFVYDWKCENVDSPILTPDRGWVRMGDLKVGEFVVGSNGKPTRLKGIYPKGQREVYEVEFLDGTIVECDYEHAWYVKDYSGKFGIKETKDILNKPAYQRYAVPLPSGPVEFDKSQDLPMHPYVLGSLIGDGTFMQSTLCYSSQSGETVDLLRQYADDGTTFSDYRTATGNSWGILGPWRDQLKKLGLWQKRSAEKFIPKEYLFASIENRILLLQGLCDTDGNSGMLRFTTTSRQLAEDFRHLVWSLGGNAYLNNSQERLHQNGTTINVAQYGVNYWLPESIEPNQLARKRIGRVKRTKGLHRGIREVRATGRMAEMQCIRVEADDHLYMTNNFILTHNTTSRILDEDADASFLLLDDQISSYVWALRALGVDVQGFVYVEIKKAYPSNPKELTRLYKGRRFSTDKNTLTTAEMYREFVMEHDEQAYLEGLYDDHLAWLKREGPRFHQRHQIHKNDAEVDAVGHNIWLEAQDIVNNPRVYPQPGRFSCNTCLFKQPCIGVNMGEDFQWTLDSMFEKRTRHYYEEGEASTE